MAVFHLQEGKGQEKAFAEFASTYQQYHKAVYANIYKVVKAPRLAEDVFQEVFLTLWEHLTTRPEKDSLASWLFVVSHNKAKACLKKELKDSLLLVESYTPFENELADFSEDKSTTDAQLEIIHQAVEHLSPRRRQVFTLSKFEGKSIEEIAEQMSTTPATVKEYLKQSVRLVRKHIMQDGGVAEGALLLVWMLEQYA